MRRRRAEMDFRFTAEDEAFREEIREFLREELPSAGSRDSDGWRGHRAFIKKLAERGWLTQAWPMEWGGSGASFMRQLVFNEEMADWEAPANDLGVDRVGPTIMLHGTEERKRRVLTPIVRVAFSVCQGVIR